MKFNETIFGTINSARIASEFQSIDQFFGHKVLWFWKRNLEEIFVEIVYSVATI